MSNEEEALPPNSDSITDRAKDESPDPRSREQANKLRIETFREVIAPTLELMANLVWRVLLLAAGVWLFAKYLDR